MLLHKIKLNSTKSSASKNGMKNGDILRSINDTNLPQSGSKEEAKKILFETASSLSVMKLLVTRDDKDLEFTIRTKNHGIEIETIDLNEVAKAEEEAAKLERQKNKDVELQIAMEKHKENYKLANKNKTIIVHSPFLRHFFVCQYSPELQDDLSIKDHVKKLSLTEEAKLLLDYTDTIFEVAFEKLEDNNKQLGLKLARNKMLSVAYLDVNEDISISDNNKTKNFNYEPPTTSIMLYYLAVFSILGGFYIASQVREDYAGLFLIFGFLSCISYVWFGKVLSYLEGLKQLLIKSQ